MESKSATTILPCCTIVVDRTAERLVDEGELPWHPSFFEMLTAMAFEYFARRKVDIAVLEVGMGGRLDATNVVEPRVSVITDISLDHQKYLGNTLAEIAREKAGIIRPGGIVVTLPQQPQANDVIGNTILDMGASGECCSLRAATDAGFGHSDSGCLVAIRRAIPLTTYWKSWENRFWWKARWSDDISYVTSRWRLRPQKN